MRNKNPTVWMTASTLRLTGLPRIHSMIVNTTLEPSSAGISKKIEIPRVTADKRRHIEEQVLESCVPVTRLTLAIAYMSCTSFSYVLLRLTW